MNFLAVDGSAQQYSGLVLLIILGVVLAMFSADHLQGKLERLIEARDRAEEAEDLACQMINDGRCTMCRQRQDSAAFPRQDTEFYDWQKEGTDV